MNDIKTIFMRIRADRLIFIADTCYSGASGGRTMMASKTRANLSDKFYERISKGKGRVIINIFNRSTPVEQEYWQVEAV